MVNYYKIDYDPDLDLYTVLNTHKGVTYELRRKKDGGFEHECKATSVYGDSYLCRHKKLIIQRYFVNDEKMKKMFNLTKK